MTIPRERDPEARAWLRLQDALDEVHIAARALGLDVRRRGELYAPLPLRVDAWLWRTGQLLGDQSWRRLDGALRAEASRAAA